MSAISTDEAIRAIQEIGKPYVLEIMYLAGSHYSDWSRRLGEAPPTALQAAIQLLCKRGVVTSNCREGQINPNCLKLTNKGRRVLAAIGDLDSDLRQQLEGADTDG